MVWEESMRFIQAEDHARKMAQETFAVRERFPPKVPLPYDIQMADNGAAFAEGIVSAPIDQVEVYGGPAILTHQEEEDIQAKADAEVSARKARVPQGMSFDEWMDQNKNTYINQKIQEEKGQSVIQKFDVVLVAVACIILGLLIGNSSTKRPYRRREPMMIRDSRFHRAPQMHGIYSMQDSPTYQPLIFRSSENKVSKPSTEQKLTVDKMMSFLT